VYQNFIIPYLNGAQYVSGDTPPIIRSLKLQKQHLVLHNTVEGCRTCSCWTLSYILYIVYVYNIYLYTLYTLYMYIYNIYNIYAYICTYIHTYIYILYIYKSNSYTSDNLPRYYAKLDAACAVVGS
jgi:hypothetical protein